jgi:two-component system sensor histidine kinase FlrB
MDAEIVTTPAPALGQAFATFTAATARLEDAYTTLSARARMLTAELEEKNRLLAESAQRERRLEAEALRQSRLAAMGEMAAMLAHEVRNPLGAMELFTGLLLQDLRDRPDTQRLARQVAQGIVDLNHLVTNLLEFTRTQVPRQAIVDCGAVLEDALRYTADLRAAHGVTVTRRYDPATPAAHADPELLRPVLLNLIRNAVQAMPGGGAVTVGVAGAGDAVDVMVTDTGPGIPETEHETIFRPFYTTRAKGTGLGLAVARELVQAMGGSLGVTSVVGAGACFTVRLAAATEAA